MPVAGNGDGADPDGAWGGLVWLQTSDPSPDISAPLSNPAGNWQGGSLNNSISFLRSGGGGKPRFTSATKWLSEL